MKKTFYVLLSIILLFVASSCGTEEPSNVDVSQLPASGADEDDIENDAADNLNNSSNIGDKKILVAYFSRSGNTEAVAKMINEQVGGDFLQIKTADPYPQDYDDVLGKAQEEKRENARPKLDLEIEDISGYDIVFIGYPIWFGDTPMAILTFLEGNDFSDKTLIPFCTSGSTSPQDSYGTIKNAASESNILEGFWTTGSETADARDDIVKWLSGLDI